MEKLAIITGAAGGLGKSTVEKFLEKKYKVIATIRPGKKLGIDNPLLEEISLDLSKEVEVEAFVKEVVKKHDKIDAAIMLVGGFAMGDISSTTGQDIKDMYALNFETAYFLARPVFQQMISQESGRMVFIGSKPALSAKDGKGTLAYALSKSLLIKLSEHLNEEGKGKNVASYIIAPSIIDTPQNRKDMPNADLSKWVKPQAIAEIIEFTCSGSGSELRDTVLKVYGGS
ncbi:MAG TPA: SDR family NAD(P)-dependent oxidoreductase [Cytophagales bacterium]|nr:SDR family NAD(P)-dependent oxidoreductase [Cytophagales bacterium]